MEERKTATKCVQAGYSPKSGEANVMPINMSTTYRYETTQEMAHLFDVPKDGHIYTRISNPTTSVFETKLAQLEGGSGALACSSGMAAELLAVITVANAGDNILALSTIYGGSFNLFKVTLPKMGIEVRFFTPDSTDEEIESLIDEKTKMFYGETVANPAMVVFDFDRYSAICKKYKLLLCVDNTLATPILVKPFNFGANVIIHSTTKYLDGHAVSVGGAVIDGGNFKFENNPRYKDFYTPDESYHGTVYTKEGGNSAYILKARMQYMRDLGMGMSPFNAFLTNLGTETLALRMREHSNNALACAKYLSGHSAVEWVRYPGLKSDKYHNLGEKYFKGGCSGMLVFGIRGGKEAGEKFINSLNMIRQLTHIADVRSCVLHPASTTHRQLSDSDLISCGISSNLIRLSIGIEDKEDIISDIEQALFKSQN